MDIVDKFLAPLNSTIAGLPRYMMGVRSFASSRGTCLIQEFRAARQKLPAFPRPKVPHSDEVEGLSSRIETGRQCEEIHEG